MCPSKVSSGDNSRNTYGWLYYIPIIPIDKVDR